MKTAIFVDVQNIYYTTRDQFGRSFNYKWFWDQIESKDEIVKANAYAIDKGDEKQKKLEEEINNNSNDYNKLLENTTNQIEDFIKKNSSDKPTT